MSRLKTKKKRNKSPPLMKEVNRIQNSMAKKTP